MDAMLRMLVQLVEMGEGQNPNARGTGVTLLVNGAWVTGKLISVERYTRLLAETFRAAQAAAIADAMEEQINTVAPPADAVEGDGAEGEGGDDAEAGPRYLHILDANMMGQRRPPVAQRGAHILMRIRAESVDGWFLGEAEMN